MRRGTWARGAGRGWGRGRRPTPRATWRACFQGLWDVPPAPACGAKNPVVPAVLGVMPEGILPRKGQVWEGLLSPPKAEMKARKKNKGRDPLFESPNFTTVTQSTTPQPLPREFSDSCLPP